MSRSSKMCAGCSKQILERYLLSAVDGFWHTDCLRCSCCGVTLNQVGTSCFTKEGMILCRNDYIRLYGQTGACAGCSQNIPATEKVFRAAGGVYHVTCLKCILCAKRLVTGDIFYAWNKQIYCHRHGGPTRLENTKQNRCSQNKCGWRSLDGQHM